MAVGLKIRNAKGEVTFDSTYQKPLKQNSILTIAQSAWSSSVLTSYSNSEGLPAKMYYYNVAWLDPSKHMVLDQACWVEAGRICKHTLRAQNTWSTEYVVYEF